MKKLIFLALLLIVSAVNVQFTHITNFEHNNSPDMQKQEKEAIETLLQTYKQSLNTSDAKLAASLYAKEGIFMPTEAPSAIGTDNIFQSYEFIFSQIRLSIEFYIEEIFVEGNLAYAMTSSKGTTLIHATGTSVPEANRELFVFEKVAGDWKISKYMFNKTAPKKQ